jgi:4-amino-4-deoxy-L-arabinose transferase-like glycosyltransferase
MNLRFKLILVGIIILAFGLRFYQLGSNPPSLDWDEAALGYNAYSLLKTGQDEYGTRFPLTFRSFDDYKPPVYVYLTIPSVAIFGLNDWAVRFPSAFLGTLTVVVFFLLVKELLGNLKLALLAMLFLAISPWHLQFSRVAFETNIALSFTVFGAWAFFRGLKKGNFLILAILLFGTALYSYHSARAFVPLLGLSWVVIFRKKLIKFWRHCLLAAILGIIIILPLISIMTSVEGRMRLKGVSSISDQAILYQSIGKIQEDQESGNYLLGRLFHNRRLVFAKILLQGYSYHFNLNWLFLKSDLNRHHAPGVGLLYLWELPFVLAGAYFLIKKKPKFYQVIFLWLLLAPVPAAPTTELPHAVRTLNMVIPLHLLSAYGFYQFIQLVKKKTTLTKKIFLLVVSGLLAANFFYYLHQYYVHMPLDWSSDWQYGRKQAVEATESMKDRYNKVVVSIELEQPHMFWLYNLKYDPVQYLAEGGTTSGGFAEVRNKFDKYEFRPIDWEKDKNKEDTLFVGLPKEFPRGISAVKMIYYLDGEEAIKIVGKI